MNKSIAVVLGGTSPHIRLINNLKNRGYETVLVDYYDTSPARQFADRHIKSSTLDQEVVLDIAKSLNASLVISTCIDQANVTACYVGEKLGLPIPYSYQTALDVSDKGRMKKIFKSNNIPSSNFQVITSVDEIDWEKIIFPVVIKPVDCNSSKGVYRADTKDEVTQYVTQDLLLSRTHNVIVEVFVSGYEIQVDCFAKDDGADVIMTRQKRKIVSDKNVVLQSTGSVIPAPLDIQLKRDCLDIANKIAKGFHLKNTPFFYQAIVNNNGINVLEFAPRIGGGLSYYLINELTGFEPIDAAVNSFLGVKNEVIYHTIDKYYSTHLLYMSPGIFDHIEGLEELKQKGVIKEFFVTKLKGTVIDNCLCSSNRVGSFVIEADSYSQLEQKSIQAYSNIVIKDINGSSVLSNIISK